MLEPSRAGITAAALFLACGIASTGGSSLADELAPGVRGVATRAPQGVKIDGHLSEFRDAFVTPVEYFHDDIENRAAQFLYMWDDEAFYAGLRTLDQKQANLAPDDRLWEGDGVEWYFDTRRGEGFRGPTWGPGAVHCYWTAYKGVEVIGRFCLRPGYLDAIPKKGVEVAARKTRSGAEVEFKLPWANFPGFQPKRGEVIGLDAELCYSDGGSRVFRTFAYGSPLSVDQPASLARVQLVEKLEPGHWKACGPVLAPIRCDTAWSQKGAAQVTALMALPPGSAERIGKVLFRLTGLEGSTIREVPGEIQVFESEGDFRRAVARWPLDAAGPGSYQLTGILLDPEGKEMARVAPRLVSVNMERGY